MFVIKVKFYNVAIMTSTEEGMIMKSATSSINNGVTLGHDGRRSKNIANLESKNELTL